MFSILLLNIYVQRIYESIYFSFRADVAFPLHYDAYLLQNNTIDRNLRLLFQFGDIMLLERGSRKIKWYPF